MIQLLNFQWHDLINPQFYIEYGGLWLLLFVIFAETGLFAGFFLPGDSLLFVAGIYSADLASQVMPVQNEYTDLIFLWIIISIAGILGNFMGYWFGQKSGPFLKMNSFCTSSKICEPIRSIGNRSGVNCMRLKFAP